MKVYIVDLGYRDTNADAKQIIWFWTQKAKLMSDRERVSFFVQMKKTWTDTLIKAEAYEILQFINEQVTTEQERQREKAAVKAKIKAELEMQEFEKRAEETRKKNYWLKLFQYYNTPN